MKREGGHILFIFVIVVLLLFEFCLVWGTTTSQICRNRN